MQSKPASSSQKLSAAPYVCLSAHCEALNRVGDQLHAYGTINMHTVLGRAVSSTRFTTPLPNFIKNALFSVKKSTQEDSEGSERTTNETNKTVVNKQTEQVPHPCSDCFTGTASLNYQRDRQDSVEVPFMSTHLVDPSGSSLFPLAPSEALRFSTDVHALLDTFEKDFGIAPSSRTLSGGDYSATQAVGLSFKMYPARPTFTPVRGDGSQLPPEITEWVTSSSTQGLGSEGYQADDVKDLKHTTASSLRPSQNTALYAHLTLHTLAQALLILQLPGRSPAASFQLHRYRPCSMVFATNRETFKTTLEHTMHFSIRPHNKPECSTRHNLNTPKREFLFQVELKAIQCEDEKDSTRPSVGATTSSNRKRAKAESEARESVCFESTSPVKEDRRIALRCSSAFPLPLAGQCYVGTLPPAHLTHVLEHAEALFLGQGEPLQRLDGPKLCGTTNCQAMITKSLVPHFFRAHLVSQENDPDETTSHVKNSTVRIGCSSAPPFNPQHGVGLAQKHSFEFLRCLAHLSWCMDIVDVVERAWGHPPQASHLSVEGNGDSHSRSLSTLRAAVLLALPIERMAQSGDKPWSSIIVIAKSGAPQNPLHATFSEPKLIICSLNELLCCLVNAAPNSSTHSPEIDKSDVKGVVICATGCGSEGGQLEWKVLSGLFESKGNHKAGVLSGKLKDFCHFIEKH